jgi:hypothetical protein
MLPVAILVALSRTAGGAPVPSSPSTPTDCLGGICLGDSARDANDATVTVAGVTYLRTAKQCLGQISQVSLEHDYVVCVGPNDPGFEACKRVYRALNQPATDFDPKGALFREALVLGEYRNGQEGWSKSQTYTVEGSEVLLFRHPLLGTVSRMIMTHETEMFPFARPPPAFPTFSASRGGWAVTNMIADLIIYESERKAYEATLEEPPEDGFAMRSIALSTSIIGACK